ncbi:Flavonoid 3',5'-hydroxylase [Hibiscus syriacus]|uniref:Flavonoid 3',5'-hydroxylase n=1 Tax=Hibiscus syriacus TaxID=106335 RepID=A0A6A2WRV0_HIBSY|nr:Flavonoid 3',5'-hydroxylase [Hibiscus syriacus]
MGTCNMVVASTPDAARAFLRNLDLNFSNRPPNAGATHLADNSQDMVFADNGPRWKLLRKLSNLHMLGGSESNEFKDMVVELMTSAGIFNFGDFIPSIAWMDLQGVEGKMKKLHKRWDALLTKMMEEHAETANERKGKPDFLDILMANTGNSDGEELSLVNVKALLLNLFTAGTDTSSSVIEWALAEIMKNPEILKKAHEEMDEVVGRNRRLEESDIPKLTYLQSICKETFRKHPFTPLNLPRVSIQAYPDVWENPMDFNLERFLSGKIARTESRGNDFELIPFGAGRRICAGTRMGIVLVEYILGTLVYSFDWMVPPETGELNMDEAFGLALQKAVPLSASPRPRLEPTAYVS